MIWHSCWNNRIINLLGFLNLLLWKSTVLFERHVGKNGDGRVGWNHAVAYPFQPKSEQQVFFLTLSLAFSYSPHFVCSAVTTRKKKQRHGREQTVGCHIVSCSHKIQCVRSFDCWACKTIVPESLVVLRAIKLFPLISTKQGRKTPRPKCRKGNFIILQTFSNHTVGSP